MLARAAAVVLLAAFACTAAGAGDAAPRGPQIPITIATDGGDQTFQAEIADTPDERQLGLMHRTAMREKDGMIFLFPREQPLSFWMRNTLIPLDMVFIKADHTILGIVENATPKTDSPRRVDGNSQFVLELNGGSAKKFGLHAGQMVKFYAPLPER
ncbi:MAG: DUF192 domain-containing protein [Myxococcota bacterium]